MNRSGSRRLRDATTGRRLPLIVLLALAGLTLSHQAVLAADPGKPTAPDRAVPRLHTNESAIVAARRSSDELAIADAKAVFDYVLAQLPARVKVYPTENYYYFSFLHGSVAYRGNIRLDAKDRDAGKLHFAYFRAPTPWMRVGAVTQRVFDGSEGVTVEKRGPLVYRVGNGRKTVVFELNDLSHAKPPSGAVLPQERYLGPVFDESGLRFFLVFNRRAKVFHYVLDTTAPVGDRLTPTTISDRITVGVRTGFAFYEDHRTARKILIGVYAQNEQLNNQYDGPFDQLPDNFINGNGLQRAILATDPTVAGKIDRFGHFGHSEMRYLIGPYASYYALTELAPVDACARKNVAHPLAYAACLAPAAIEARQ